MTHYSLTHGGNQPTKADICELKNEPLQKGLSKESIIQAFAGAGIWPVDATRAMDRLKRRKSKISQPINVPSDLPLVVDAETLAANLTSPIKRKLEEDGISVDAARTHVVMFSHVIAPNKRRSLIKNEQEACIWLDEGGLLTSDDIQEKIKARELKRAKANKQAAEQKKLQAKLVREQKQAEAQAKRDAKAEQKAAKAQAKVACQNNQHHMNVIAEPKPVEPEVGYRIIEI